MSVDKIRWLQFPAAAAVKDDIYEPFSYEQSADVRRLHESLADYAATPLVSLDGMAGAGGVKAVFVKDESPRFGLKAFKGLGGTYAMFRMICKELGLDPAATAFEDLLREPYAARVHELVFITTTDGNHGKGVSWAAKLFGCKAHVFMPVGTVEVRAQAIRDAGNADVVITDMPYDACVNYTAALAEENGWLLIQDTSWDGYEDVPLWIMRGYTTLFYEATAQLKTEKVTRTTRTIHRSFDGSVFIMLRHTFCAPDRCGVCRSLFRLCQAQRAKRCLSAWFWRKKRACICGVSADAVVYIIVSRRRQRGETGLIKFPESGTISMTRFAVRYVCNQEGGMKHHAYGKALHDGLAVRHRPADRHSGADRFCRRIRPRRPGSQSRP